MDNIQEGVHISSEEASYIAPKDPKVITKLEQFRDMKIGFMTHFGIFTQLAVVESWALSDELKEDRWSQGGIDWVDDIEDFKDQYWNLNKSFNPGRLDPTRFANGLSSMGFKYVLLPTKHHDGFCLWDTKYTDYRVTHSDCPFSTNKHADVFGELTRAFQKRNVMTGAYFSKADWHHDDYWPEEYKHSGKVHRNPGYDVKKHPEKWERFVQFTKNQMIEIVQNYDPIDIMWLDAGQVCARNNQDIRLSEIVAEMRKINPGLIVCDRTIGGENENYITPEQQIPDHYISVPWESCISLGGPFAFAYKDNYKTAQQVAHLFIEILCKGGNLALNVAPQPDGKLPTDALKILNEFMQWVRDYDHAITGTRPVAPYFEKNVGFVVDKNGQEYMHMKGGGLIPKWMYTTTSVDFKSVKFDGQEVKLSKIGKKWKFEMPEYMIDLQAPLGYVFEIERKVENES